MNSATAVPSALRLDRDGLTRIARALAWEECRVGGMVAAVCTVAAWLMLGSLMLQMGRFGETAWVRGDGFQHITVSVMPMLLALLLVLNPANSGHLMGGFARRVLWLPAPAPLAVAVALGMRTLFMAAAVTGIIGVTHLMLAGGPPFTLVALFVMLYLAVQTLDWLRGVVSGLTSLLAGAVVLLLLLFSTRYNGFMLLASAAQGSGWTMLLPAALGALLAAYALSIAAVHATRTGRTIGVPEVWEWPRYFERGARETPTPFRSPVAAQVWFEWRRYGWTLPAGTVALTLFLSVFYSLGQGGLVWAEIRDAAAFAVFPAVLLSALAHGVRARVLGIRSNPGKPGFDFLLPRSSAETALAKCLVGALALVPTVLVAGALHLAIGSGNFFTDLVPYALERGITSPREVAWSASSRVILLLLLAWPLTAIGTRGMRWLLAALIAGEVLAVVPNIPYTPLDPSIARPLQAALSIGMPLVLVLAAIAAFALAWRRRLFGAGTVAAFGALGLLTAWLLNGALPDAAPLHTRLLESLAWGALVPLPFALYTLDAARKRQGNAVTQAEGASTVTRLTMRPWGWGLAAATVLAVLWMGWPSEPAFKGYLEAQGAPVSRADLNDIYPAVPDEENAALRLAALGAQATELESVFGAREYWRDSAEAPESDARWYQRIYGVSHVPLRTPLDPERMDFTRAYWADVSAQVTPALREIALQGPHRSRYPTDLRDGFSLELSHLPPLRNLSRLVSVDTFLASLDGDTPRALDNLRATLMLQDSLANEPVLISGLVRIAILGIGLSQVEIMLNFAPLTDADLESLDLALRHALPPLHEHRILDGPFRGERMISVLTLDDWMDEGYTESEPVQFALTSPMTLTPVRLAMPLSAERTALLGLHERIRERAAEMAQMTVPPARPFRDEDPVDDILFHIAPVASIVLPSLSMSYLAEWRIRMQIDIARTAIAAERYRREHGRLPDTLDELVPGHIEAIPYDVLAREAGRQVGYAVRDDGSFVVYSVGMSGRDDGGCSRSEDEGCEGDDLTFTVIRRSTGPGVELEERNLSGVPFKSPSVPLFQRGRNAGEFGNEARVEVVDFRCVSGISPSLPPEATLDWFPPLEKGG